MGAERRSYVVMLLAALAVLVAWVVPAVGGRAAVAVAAPADPPLPLVQIASEPVWKAWWLRADLQPTGTQIRGLPLPRLHPQWCFADEFTRDRFPAEVFTRGDGVDALAAERAAFTLEGHFDGGPRRLVATVGAYERCTGEIGHFLLVLDPTPRGLKLRYLLERPFDGSVLTVLRQVDARTLRFSPCLACDEGVLLRWNPQTRHFEPRPLKSDDDSED